MAGTRWTLHQLLKGKQLYSALYGMYTEVLHDLIAVLKECAAKRETAETTITAPPSIEEFHGQIRRKWKPTDDADNRAKKPTKSTTAVNELQSLSNSEVPTRNFFAPLTAIEIEADHGDEANDTTERQQHQAPSSQAGRRVPLY
jgi:hypothetical protein